MFILMCVDFHLLRQTRKYLEFLQMSDMIKSSSQSKFDNDTIGRGDIVYKILGFDDKTNDKSPKLLIDHKSRKALIGNEKMIESSSELNLQEIGKLRHLLQQEDARYHHSKTTERSGFGMKKVKDVSKELINKKLNAFKAMRTNSSSQESSEPIETKNNFTIYTPTSSLRSSATDLGARIKRVRRTKPKYGSSSNEGAGMTTLLVRSLMAAPSLDCISENADNTRKPSLMPSERTDSLASLPTLPTTSAIPGHRRRNKLNLTLGDSLIDLKASDSNVSSNAVTSCEESSLSEEEQEEEESEYDESEKRSIQSNENNEVVLIDADTINMVVKSALAMDEEQTGESIWIRPSDLDDDSDDTNRKEDFKHLDIRSFKTGATRIISSRDNKKKKDVKTCLMENDAKPEMMEHILYDVLNAEEESWIQPGSTAPDDGDDTNEPRHSSLLHSFKESISEKIHHIHLPHSHSPHGSKPEIRDHGLLGTAMENMLLEQAELLGAHAQSPSIEQAKLESSKRNSSFDSLRKLLTSPFRRVSNDPVESLNEKSNISVSSPSSPLEKKKFNLVDTAMKTMVTETAHIIEGIGINPIEEPKSLQPNDDPGDLENRNLLSSSLSKSYNNFCDNFRGSQILDQFSTEKKLPIFMLTQPSFRTSQENPLLNKSLHSLTSLPPNQRLVPNTRSYTQSLQSIPCDLRKSCTHSNPHNQLTPATTDDIGTSINQTNITKSLAPRSCPKSRSGDTITTATNKSMLTPMANGNNQTNSNHLRSDPNTDRNASSPNKVPNSSSYGNTALAAANPATPIDPKDQDKDKENNICRRSSDSDLSITPKGKRMIRRLNYSKFHIFLIRSREYLEFKH